MDPTDALIAPKYAHSGVPSSIASPRQSDTPASTNTQDAIVLSRPALINDGPQQVQDRFQPSGLYAQSHEFLERVKSRFGVNSKESVAIHDTLGEFRAGRVAKHDVYLTILAQLGDSIDLNQDLQGILRHQDVFWGYQDAHQQEVVQPTPASQPSPGFLQPQHQPHMRMPSMSALWSPDQYTQRLQPVQPSINPELLRAPIQHTIYDPVNNGYEYHGSTSYQPTYAQDSYNNGYAGSFVTVSSSPATQAPIQPASFDPYVSPVMGHMQTPTFPPHTGLSNDSQLSSPFHGPSSQPQHSYLLNDAWERAQYGNTWGEQFEQEPTGSKQMESPALSNRVSTSQSASPYQSSLNATPSVLGTPIAIPLGQPTFEMLPAKNCSQKESQAYPEANEEEVHEEDYEEKHEFRRPSAPATVPSAQPSSVRRSSVRAPPSQGQYVHALCGKTFTTRYAVKKHHWGARTEDIATSTGCWAKKGKPNVQWDDHPSCREQTPKARATKSHRPGTSQMIPPEFRAPVAPDMVSNLRNTIPGFPTLNELPQMVANALQGTPVPPQFPQGETVPYHSHRLPVRSSLDTLLTAVNFASKIDAPKPQGRNDSVVSHLDAQAAAAAAAESRRYQSTSRFGAPQDQPDTALSHDSYELPSLPVVGQGITQSEQEYPATTSEVIQSEQKTEHTAVPDMATPSKTNGGVDGDQASSGDQPQTDIATASQEKENRKRGRRGSRSSGISKRELKMLGLVPSPEPERKKQKSAGLVNGVPV